MAGTFMCFKAVNEDAVVQIGAKSNINGSEGQEETILQGDILWNTTPNPILVSGTVYAYDAE